MSAGDGLRRIARGSRSPVPTMLGVWAHPDDEAYLSAGLMARAAEEGWRVVVATATRGEQGADDPAAMPPDRLAVMRERELADSLAALGVSEHRWLRSSRTLVDGALADVPSEEGRRAVARLLAEVAPDLVVTFGPDGLTGHSDHRAVSRWTRAAWQRDGARADLWYAGLTHSFLDRWGGLCSELGVWMADGPPEPVDPGGLAHVQLCAGPLLARKFAALQAHRSQTAGLIERVGEDRYRDWWSTESFVAARTTTAALGEVA
jgi:LmbE family N-acetylglucosaminyl deacetylase